MELDFDFSEPPPVLNKLAKSIGQMFMVGFSGYEVNPQIRELITKYNVGSIILSVKNLKDAASTRELILELQKIAHEAGHEYPLLIAIDQENGMLNNLHDEEYLSQFPGPMAIVATKSLSLAKDVAHATGIEIKSLGINWLLGPILDVLTNSTNRLLGVRTMGDDAQEVTQYGLAFLQGYNQAGINTCGKHFPGYGNATVDSMLGLPIVPESIEQLETASLIPFRQTIKAGIDSIMVGGCALPKIAMNEMHACLSERVVRELLREDMGFDGVVLSECLEMAALYENVGVRQGAVMAAVADCDIILVCSSYRLQKQAISGIFGAVQGGILEEDAIYVASERVARMKRKHLSWSEALNPKPLSYLKELKAAHLPLSRTAYEHSITLLRDHARYIPLSKSVEPDGDIVLLTPLVTPIISTKYDAQSEHLLLGEVVFQEFGRSLAKLHSGKVLHASYTANGLMSMHDSLIERAKAVIVVTADANRNMYQVGFSKHVSVICSQQRKPLVAIAASSPYDLALDSTIGTYLCLYEFTYEALNTTAKVLFGLLPARGNFPGSGLYQQSRASVAVNNGVTARSTRNKWLVEKWSFERDVKRLRTLWESCFPDRRLGPGLGAFQMLKPPNEGADSQTHFIVRNSSTNNLYGFCATWVYEEQNIGSIVMIFVEPSRRGMAIGRSLHDRAMKYLIKERKVQSVHIGSCFPSYFLGIPSHNHKLMAHWFEQAGWTINTTQCQALMTQDPTVRNSLVEAEDESRDMHARSTMLLRSLQEWAPSKKLISELEMVGIKFDICQTKERLAEISNVIKQYYSNYEGLLQLYQEAWRVGDAKIIAALDPVKRVVVGSIILFTRGSTIAGYLPWILEFEDARVGGLCAVITDPVYKDLTEVFTLGLVGCGVRQFKLQGFERCVLDGADDRQARSYADNGFEVWRRYVHVENRAKSFNVM